MPGMGIKLRGLAGGDMMEPVVLVVTRGLGATHIRPEGADIHLSDRDCTLGVHHDRKERIHELLLIYLGFGDDSGEPAAVSGMPMVASYHPTRERKNNKQIVYNSLFFSNYDTEQAHMAW